MGNVSYWYKKILQNFVDTITQGKYDEITKSILEEESEETLENFILKYRQSININKFYFNAGIVTDQIISETRTIGNDSSNAATFALCNFMELIGLESEAETKMINRRLFPLLEPCPFCGKVDYLDYGYCTGTLEGYDYVECGNCNVSMAAKHKEGRNTAVEKWNDRAIIGETNNDL